jgi:hypothetical protein
MGGTIHPSERASNLAALAAAYAFPPMTDKDRIIVQTPNLPAKGGHLASSEEGSLSDLDKGFVILPFPFLQFPESRRISVN